MALDPEIINKIVDIALEEDMVHGDITTRVLVSPEIATGARLCAKDSGVLAGVTVAETVFLRVDSSLQFHAKLVDGAQLNPGTEIATISGSAASILKAERVALNFIQRMSGIASITARYIATISGLPAHILDTRKTVPGLRMLDKYAVKMGGGDNHRFNLSDSILIKDNHLAILHARGVSLEEVVARARQGAGPEARIEIEVQSVDDALTAAKAGADIVMLDNMSLDEIRRAVKEIGSIVLLEASGNVTLETVRAIAEAGVDFISVGSLTHSVKALDISLDMD